VQDDCPEAKAVKSIPRQSPHDPTKPETCSIFPEPTHNRTSVGSSRSCASRITLLRRTLKLPSWDAGLGFWAPTGRPALYYPNTDQASALIPLAIHSAYPVYRL
jgi:hypothetical protein